MSLSNLVFKNCRIFLGDPAIILDNHFLVTNNDLIERFDDMKYFDESHYHPNKFDIIDCKNMILMPGMIDVHVHFRDPGFKIKEDIKTGSESAAAGGFTSVICMPNTKPVLDNPLVISYFKEQIKLHSKINIGFYSSATINMEGGLISPVQTMISNGAIGFTDDGLPISNMKILKTLLEYSAQMDFVVAQHAEDHNLSNMGCINHGRFAKRFNFKTIDPASEYSTIASNLSLVENIKNAKYHILHISCKESIEYLKRAKEKNLSVTSEITPHHFILNDDSLFENLAYAKMNPPLRSDKDIEVMIDGIKNGLIDIIASDHAPHESFSKDQSISCAPFGIVGLETMLALSCSLYHKNYISLEKILSMLTFKPACLIKQSHIRGKIAKNYKADLCIIDEEEVWKIDKRNFASKSNNTPFDNMIAKGRNICTICDGKIIFQL
jgi:dihydroorotase